MVSTILKGTYECRFRQTSKNEKKSQNVVFPVFCPNKNIGCINLTKSNNFWIKIVILRLYRSRKESKIENVYFLIIFFLWNFFYKSRKKNSSKLYWNEFTPAVSFKHASSCLAFNFINSLHLAWADWVQIWETIKMDWIVKHFKWPGRFISIESAPYPNWAQK